MSSGQPTQFAMEGNPTGIPTLSSSFCPAVATIAQALRAMPHSERQTVITHVLRLLEDEARADRQLDPPIEALYFWDLLPLSTYRAVHYLLDYDEDIRAMPWEDRRLSLVVTLARTTQLLSRDFGIKQLSELTLALEVYGFHIPDVEFEHSCRGLRKARARTERKRLVERIEKRRIQRTLDLKIWSMRSKDRMSVDEIAEQVGIGTNAVRGSIRRGAEANERLAVLPAPPIWDSSRTAAPGT